MKNWKSNRGLKAVMALLSVLMAAVMVLSGAAVILIANIGAYEETKEENLKWAYEWHSEIYAVMAIANRESDEMKESLNQTNFRYGIIKAEDLNEVDISDPASYEYYNFETMPKKDALKEEEAGVYDFMIGPGTEYTWSNTLFGLSRVYASEETTEEADTEQIPITGYYYNTSDGMFYYETWEEYYRVDRVELPVGTDGQLLPFKFDSGQKRYYNLERDYCIDPDYYLTFDAFDNTDYSWETWEQVSLDGTYYDHTQIRFIIDENSALSGEIQGKPIADHYYAQTDGSYIWAYTRDVAEDVPVNEAPKEEHYHVVYQVQNPLKATGITSYGSFFEGDLYEQVTALYDFCYDWKYTAIILLAVSFLLWAVSTVLLLVTAGHKGYYEDVEVQADQAYGDDSEHADESALTEKRWKDCIKTGRFQKIWFDVETVAVMTAGGVALAAAAENFIFSYNSAANLINLIIAFVFCMAGYIIGLLWLWDFAIRIKAGKWWRGTLTYKVLAWLGRYVKKAVCFFRENISLLWKALCILGGLCFIEFLGILLAWNSVDAALFLWFIYRAATVAVILIGIVQADKLKSAAIRMAQGDLNEKVKTEKMCWEFKKHGESLNSISDGINLAVEQRMQSEHFRTELITNVSHDIKTPLTSIINYVDLLEKEDIDNEKVREYLEVLSRQSARLKKLTEDLIEASKASTGSLSVQIERLELGVFLTQTIGEFEEKLAGAGLHVIMHKPEQEVTVSADGRHLWRVVENLVQNICKYAQPDTRVYIDLKEEEKEAVISFKNVSRYELNITGKELMERFVRGDASRHTEGSGLGLSIAESLMLLMGGRLEIIVDGDLFKVVLYFQKES